MQVLCNDMWSDKVVPPDKRLNLLYHYFQFRRDLGSAFRIKLVPRAFNRRISRLDSVKTYHVTKQTYATLNTIVMMRIVRLLMATPAKVVTERANTTSIPLSGFTTFFISLSYEKPCFEG